MRSLVQLLEAPGVNQKGSKRRSRLAYEVTACVGEPERVRLGVVLALSRHDRVGSFATTSCVDSASAWYAKPPNCILPGPCM